MALVRCPECAGLIDTLTATCCPDCGHNVACSNQHSVAPGSTVVTPKRRRKGIITVLSLVVFAVLFIVCYTQLTIFVIHPIGAVPAGKTLIISRLKNTQFIDSADAICERIQNGVSLLCRGMIMGAVAENATVYARLPYSEWLYLVSTGGSTYER